LGQDPGGRQEQQSGPDLTDQHAGDERHPSKRNQGSRAEAPRPTEHVSCHGYHFLQPVTVSGPDTRATLLRTLASCPKPHSCVRQSALATVDILRCTQCPDNPRQANSSPIYLRHILQKAEPRHTTKGGVGATSWEFWGHSTYLAHLGPGPLGRIARPVTDLT